MAADKLLTEIITSQVNQFCAGFDAALRRHIGLLPAPPSLSAESKKHIVKRVPPRALDNYLNLNSAIALLAVEIQDLGLRISRYQYIERYREHFEAPDADMASAFVMHTHILRGTEIYVIMERCAVFLDFYYHIAVDLSLNPTKMSKALERRFKKDFERHLRERHRIVHAHERPSLISRMTSISAEEIGKPDVASTFKETLETLMGMLAPVLKDAFNINDPALALKNLNDIRLKAVDQECLGMWSTLLDAMTRLIDPSKLLRAEEH
jgi:hypothetical protein